MIAISELTAHLNELLSIKAIADYCPNGLQVAGAENVNKIITGVTACQELLNIVKDYVSIKQMVEKGELLLQQELSGVIYQHDGSLYPQTVVQFLGANIPTDQTDSIDDIFHHEIFPTDVFVKLKTIYDKEVLLKVNKFSLSYTYRSINTQFRIDAKDYF